MSPETELPFAENLNKLTVLCLKSPLRYGVNEDRIKDLVEAGVKLADVNWVSQDKDRNSLELFNGLCQESGIYEIVPVVAYMIANDHESLQNFDENHKRYMLDMALNRSITSFESYLRRDQIRHAYNINGSHANTEVLERYVQAATAMQTRLRARVTPPQGGIRNR